ncbi:MAG: hypothetical protein WAU07_05715 [Microgenomates group bacterium]
MSHISTLKRAEEQCLTTQDCARYEKLLQIEIDKLDGYTNERVESTILIGAIFASVGFLLVLTPFVAFLRKLQAFLLPKLAVVTPIALGLAVGAGIGFMISFSACFKQSCSFYEQYAIVIFPVLSLILTIPSAKILAKKLPTMKKNILKSGPTAWIVIGAAIIALTFGGVSTRISRFQYLGEQQKKSLLHLTVPEEGVEPSRP